MTDILDKWVTTTVGESGGFLTGFPFASSGFSDNGIRLVRGSNVKRAALDWTPDISQFWPTDEPALRAFHLREGDIVIAMDGALVGRSYARIRKPDLPAYLVQRVARLRGTSVAQGLLYQWIRSDRFVQHVDSVKTHTAIPHISPQDIRGFTISIPSDFQEQKRIGDALADADDLVAALERTIAKKQAIKQGMMPQLLTGKTRLPGFTAPWRDTPLGDYVSFVKTVALSRAQLDGKSPVRYLHYGDIHTRTDVRLDAAHEPMPRASSGLLRNAGRLKVGDVVFADASEDAEGVGKSVEITAVPEAGVVPGLHTIAARFDKTVLADGFKAYLQFIPSFRQALLRLAAGTKVLSTTRSFISSITLTLPNVDEQRAIANALGDAEAEIQRLQVRLAKARDVKLGMMQELLSGRTRLPVEESAA
jgi:type I restriction enzyme S subunit